MKFINHNPFRVLSCLANTSLTDLNKSKINIEKTIDKRCDFDFPFLEPLDRNYDNIIDAFQKIEDPKNRILYSLFWFVDSLFSDADKIAFKHLREGNIKKAEDHWWAKIQEYDNAIQIKSYTAWNNLSTLRLLKSFKNGKIISDCRLQFAEALSLKRQLIEDDRFMFNFFAYKITDEPKNLNNLEYSLLFHELLMSEFESDNNDKHISKHINELRETLRKLNYYPLLLTPPKFKYSSFQIKSIISPEKVTYEFATIGASEKNFYEKLKSRFQSNILMGYTLIKDKKYLPKFADMLFCDNTNKIYIDIEIDEPYTLISGKATHCITTDDERDDYFLNENYFIIKFAEEQICKFPDACCDLVAQFYEYILITLKQKSPLLLEIFKEKNPSIAIEFPVSNEIPKIKRWDTFEAQKMVAGNYRNSYLNQTKQTDEAENLPNGIKIIYNEDGSTDHIANYKNGKLVSPFMTFHKNGNVEGICNLLNEEKNGAFIYFDQFGKVKAKGENTSNKLQGKVFIYNEDGVHIKSKYFENNILIKTHFLEDDKVIIEDTKNADDDSYECEYFF